MSDDFSYISGELCAEQIPIAELAEKYGTPFYVYSHAALTRQFSSFSNAFSSVSHLVCFAMKSNSNIAILRLFSGMGGGLDIVSGGELYRAVKAGVPGERIVFAGVGKSDEEIEYALIENPHLRVAIARYIGIYGENQDFNLETGSCIPVFTNRAINYPQIPFSVWGTGRETRSYCFIDDAIECTKLMIEKMEEKNQVGPYNVGKQERISIGDLAKAVVEVSGKDINIEYDLTKDTLIWGQWCDCSKAKEEIGFEAKTSLQEGLKRVYNDIQGRMK